MLGQASSLLRTNVGLPSTVRLAGCKAYDLIGDFQSCQGILLDSLNLHLHWNKGSVKFHVPQNKRDDVHRYLQNKSSNQPQDSSAMPALKGRFLLVSSRFQYARGASLPSLTCIASDWRIPRLLSRIGIKGPSKRDACLAFFVS
jgi:hypothetical protein